MRTFDNPHPRMQQPQQPIYQPVQQPQMTQEQAMHNALLGAMSASGFQMYQQNGQAFFHNQATGAQFSYQQAMQMMAQRARPQQPTYGYPQQQSFYQPEVAQQPFYPQNERYPNGSMQASNQRFDAPANVTPTTSEQARWGSQPQPTQPQTPSFSQPTPQQEARPVMTHPNKSTIKTPYKRDKKPTAFIFRPSALKCLGKDMTSPPAAASLYELAEELRSELADLPTTSAAPAILQCKVFHTDSYYFSDETKKSKTYQELIATDPKFIYRAMRAHASSTETLSSRAETEIQALANNLDRDLTQVVNDFMTLSGSTTMIESFCEDFNVLLKYLRDSTDLDEFSEDDLVAYLTNYLTGRLEVTTENDEKSTIFAEELDFVLVGMTIESFFVSPDSKGDLRPSETVMKEIGQLGKEIESKIFYISTLDKVLMRVYKVKTLDLPIVDILGFKD